MTYELIVALIGFAFVSSITPGPNNMMLLASGVNFGVRRTLPHMMGVSLGHAFLVFLVGVGIAQLFHQWPALNWLLKGVAVCYTLWLAWKIAHASVAPGKGLKRESGHAHPLTFFQAAAFQWVNPKGWAMALTAVTIYAGDESIYSMVHVAFIFCLVNLPSVSVWAYAGQWIGQWLSTQKRLKVFNWVMAILLVFSLLPVLQAGL